MVSVESTLTRRRFLRSVSVGDTTLGVPAIGSVAATETRPGSEPVLLVHGYGDTGETPWWDVVTGYLTDVGYPEEEIYVVNLGGLPGTTTDSPTEYADVVGYRLKTISERHESRVDVIAHSMGGLDSRWCIEKQGGAQYVDDLITLGTPHQGTYASYLGILTEGGRDMIPGSTFLEELDDGTLAKGVAYTALWSSIDELIDPSTYAKLPTAEASSVDVARNTNSGYQEHIQLVYDREVFDRYYEYLD